MNIELLVVGVDKPGVMLGWKWELHACTYIHDNIILEGIKLNWKKDWDLQYLSTAVEGYNRVGTPLMIKSRCQ